MTTSSKRKPTFLKKNATNSVFSQDATSLFDRFSVNPETLRLKKPEEIDLTSDEFKEAVALVVSNYVLNPEKLVSYKKSLKSYQALEVYLNKQLENWLVTASQNKVPEDLVVAPTMILESDTAGIGAMLRTANGRAYHLAVAEMTYRSFARRDIKVPYKSIPVYFKLIQTVFLAIVAGYAEFKFQETMSDIGLEFLDAKMAVVELSKLSEVELGESFIWSKTTQGTEYWTKSYFDSKHYPESFKAAVLDYVKFLSP